MEIYDIQQSENSKTGNPIVLVKVTDLGVTRNGVRQINHVLDPIEGTFEGDASDFIGQEVNGASLVQYELSDEELARREQNNTAYYQNNLVRHGWRLDVHNNREFIQALKPITKQAVKQEPVTTKA